MQKELVNNRYTIIRKLGIGAMGSVYLTEDRLYNNRKTALKFIHKKILNEKNLQIFKNEFDVMSRLNHPNLTKVYSFNIDIHDNNYFIAMEYVEGKTLFNYIRLIKDFDDDFFITIIVELCRAIEYIHSRNILHRDIKPGNIILTNENSIKLMDFGLADIGKFDMKKKGTLYYMAPEIIKGSIDQRVDIFSLGLTLYEALTKKSFFEDLKSHEINKLLKNKDFYTSYKNSVLTNISQHSFRKMINKMIIFNPSARFRNAPEIISYINKNFNHSFPVESKNTAVSYVLKGEFIGREKELATLKNFIADAPNSLTLISGEAGIGKTRLVNEIKKACQLDEIMFIEGNCHKAVFKLYNPFLSIVSECLFRVNDTLIERYGPQLKKILKDHPRLFKIRTAESDITPAAYQAAIKKSITGILIDFARGMQKNIIIFINDIQWADEASIDIIEDLVHTLQTSQHYLKIILSGRNEGSAKLRNVKIEKYFKRIKLKPFNKSNVKKYFTAILGNKRVGVKLKDAVPLINKKVGGNPFFLQELIKSLVENRIIIRDTFFWDLKHSIEQVKIPATINDVIKTRLHYLNLTGAETQLLNIIALLDRPSSFDELSRMTELEPKSIIRLLNAEIIKKEVSDNVMVFSPAHDLIKNNIITGIINKSALHGYIAEQLEQLYHATIDNYLNELAYHYAESNKKEKALYYLEKAGDKAMQKYDNVHALLLFDKLLNFLDDTHVKKTEIFLQMGRVYYAQSKWKMSQTVLKQALDHAQKNNRLDLVANAYILLGRTCIASYDSKSAITYYNNALELYTQLDNQKGIALCYNKLGFCYTYYLNDYAKAMEYYRKSITISNELHDNEGEANSTGNMGTLYYYMGNYDDAITCLRKTLQTIKKSDNKGHLSHAYGSLGLCYNGLKDYKKAIDYYDKAITIAKTINSPQLFALYSIEKARALYDINLPADANEVNEIGLEAAFKINEKESVFKGCLLRAKIIGNTNTQIAEELLNSMLKNADNDENIAELYYELWKITGNETAKTRSCELYQKIYSHTPKKKIKDSIDEMCPCVKQ